MRAEMRSESALPLRSWRASEEMLAESLERSELELEEELEELLELDSDEELVLLELEVLELEEEVELLEFLLLDEELEELELLLEELELDELLELELLMADISVTPSFPWCFNSILPVAMAWAAKISKG